MTYRRLLSWGLRAGLRMAEMGALAPGMICDLYIYRQRYDDEQHGVKRQKKKIYD